MGRIGNGFNEIYSAARPFLRAIPLFLLFVFIGMILTGCFRLRTSQGGGQTSFHPPRTISSSDVALPNGYRIEPPPS